MRLFAIIGGLLLAVLIAALVVPSFINWSDYKSQFEREAERLTGLPVTVTGDARVRLLPFPSLSFSGLRIGADDAPVLTAETLSVDAELAPFLSGELHIIDLRLDEPVFDLVIDGSGRVLNAAGAERQIPAMLRDVEVERAFIRNATVNIRQPDGSPSRQWRATGVDGEVAIDSLNGPVRFSGSMVLDGVPADVEIATGLLDGDGVSVNTTTVWPNRGLEIATQGRIEPASNTAGEASQVYRGRFQLSPSDETGISFAVDGSFEATGSSLVIEEYRANLGGGDEPYTVEGDFRLDSSDGRPDYALTARGVQVNLEALEAGPQDGATVSAADWVEQGRGLFARMPLPAVPGSITVDLPAIVSGSTVVRDIRFVARPGPARDDGSETWRIAQINAVFPGRTTLEGSGELVLPRREPGRALPDVAAVFSGPIVMASRQPSGLASWLGFGSPDAVRALSRAGFEGHLQASAERWSIDDLRLIIDTDELTGSAAFLPDNRPKPLVSLSLSGAALSPTTLAVFSDAMMAPGSTDLPVEADLAADFRNVTIDELTVGRVDAGLRIREDETAIDRLLFEDLEGADLSATAAISQTAGETSTDFNVSVVSADAGQFLSRAPSFLSLDGAGFDRTLMDQFAAHFEQLADRDAAAVAEANVSLQGTHRSGPEGAAVSALVSGTLGGTDVVGNLDLTDGAAPRLTATLSNPSGIRLARQIGVNPADLSGAGEFTVQLQPAERIGFDTAVNARFADLRLTASGVLTRSLTLFGPRFGFNGQIEAQGDDIATLWDATGVPWAGREAIPVRYAVDMGIAWQQGGTADLTLDDVSLNAEPVTGALSIDRVGPRAEISGSISLERVNAGPVLRAFAGLGGDAGSSETFGAELPGLPDLDLALTTGTLTVHDSGLQLADFSSRVVLDGARLAVGPFQAQMDAAPLAGSVTLQNLDGEIAVTSQLAWSEVALGALLGDTPGVADGTASVSATTAGSGRSLPSLAGSLSGSGVLSTGPITVTGLGTERFAPFIEAVDAIGFGITAEQIGAAVEEQLLSSASVFEPVETPLVIANGAARVSNLALDSATGDVSAVLNAERSLTDGSTEASVTVRHDASAVDNATLLPAFQLHWADGAIDLDTTAMEAFVTQRAIEREQQRIDALQARLLERQRFRRTVRVARFERDQRLAAEEAARAAAEEAERAEREARQAEEEARRQREAEALEAAQRAEQERQLREEAERQRLLELERLEAVVPDGDAVLRQPLPPADPPAAAPAPASGGSPPPLAPSVFQDLDFGN